MTVVVTLTLTDADAARITAVASAYGFPSPKAYVVQRIKDGVQAYEVGQAQASAVTNYTNTTQPISPT